MKFAVSFFSVVSLVVAAALFWQYQVYSDELDEAPIAYNYSQEIEVTYRGEQLTIRHHFKDLPNEEIKIDWPSSAINMSCEEEGTSECARLGEDVRTLKKSEQTTETLVYSIPLEGGLQSGRLMNDVFATLAKGGVQLTTIHISTDSSIAGQWVTGLPLIGQQSLKLVNYSMFSGSGVVKELYWQQGSLALQHKQNDFSVYGPVATDEAFRGKLNELPFFNEEHTAIVQSTTNAVSASGRIIFVPDLTVASLEQNVLFQQVQQLYQFGETPQWLSHIVASVVTDIPYGDEKTQQILTTVKEQMSEQQYAQWKQALEALQGKAISLALMDEEVSAIFGQYTRYFTMNDGATTAYPFLFNDRREVYVDEAKHDVDVILQNGQVLYAAKPLLNALGYEANVGDYGYYVKNATREYRFPREPGFYVFNQRRYNTNAEPIRIIAGNYYVEETWLQRLFVVEVKKSEERITIVTTTEQ